TLAGRRVTKLLRRGDRDLASLILPSELEHRVRQPHSGVLATADVNLFVFVALGIETLDGRLVPSAVDVQPASLPGNAKIAAKRVLERIGIFQTRAGAGVFQIVFFEVDTNDVLCLITHVLVPRRLNEFVKVMRAL